MKLCKDCKHSWQEWTTEPYSQSRHISATRCNVQVRSPVHGELGDPTCEWSRAFDGMCGINAKWWESKDQP